MKLLPLALLVPIAAAAWPQEPTAVLGIELGKPLAGISQCGPSYAQRPPGICALTDPTAKLVLLTGIPIPSVGRGAAHLHNGAVSMVTLMHPSTAYDNMLGILIERYGKPHQMETSVVTNLAGARLTSRQATWRGSRTLIVAHERIGNVTEGAVFFSDVELAAQERAATAADTKATAGKL
jgi:hypothetical protein